MNLLAVTTWPEAFAYAVVAISVLVFIASLVPRD